MGSAQATEFLAAWITRNIGPSGYDNERCARGLSIRCFEEAGAAGILGADLTEAAHGEAHPRHRASSIPAGTTT